MHTANSKATNLVFMMADIIIVSQQSMLKAHLWHCQGWK